jgi:hypothetical protein
MIDSISGADGAGPGHDAGLGATEAPDAAPGDSFAPDPQDEPPAGEGETPPAKAERMVSLAALHEERNRRKESDRARQQLERQVADLRGRFEVLDWLSRPEAAPPPKAEEDLVGAVKSTGQTLAQLKARLDRQEAERHEENERNALVSAYRADAARFEANTPDFRAAYAHLLQSRLAELQAIGIDDPRALHEAVQADEMAVAQAALARGSSPAEVIYRLATQRGYRPAAAGPDRLASIARGREANKTLSATGARAGDAEVSAEQLARMSMEDFDAWCSRNPARARRLLGG